MVIAFSAHKTSFSIVQQRFLPPAERWLLSPPLDDKSEHIWKGHHPSVFATWRSFGLGIYLERFCKDSALQYVTIYATGTCAHVLGTASALRSYLYNLIRKNSFLGGSAHRVILCSHRWQLSPAAFSRQQPAEPSSPPATSHSRVSQCPTASLCKGTARTGHRADSPGCRDDRGLLPRPVFVQTVPAVAAAFAPLLASSPSEQESPANFHRV